MEMTRGYEAAIVGAGTAGVALARSLAGAGRRTVIVERAYVGGTCINDGCTPTKTMISSARVAYLSRRARDYGITVGEVAVDMIAVRQRKRDLVESWRHGSERRLKNTENLDLIMGEAAFAGPRRLQIRAPDAAPVFIETPLVFVNTGCRPAIPSLPGLGQVPYLTSTSALELGELPEHLLILGGGYVAVEFAQMFRRFGSKVTIAQKRDQLLPREDPDVAQAVAAILEEDGVDLLMEVDVRSAETTADGGVQLRLTSPAGTRSLLGSHLLVATGRTPNTEALNVGAAGLRLDERGYLPVNERLETEVEGIYAMGDVKGGPAFTHIAYDDFRVIRTNLLEKGKATINDRLVPYTVYLDPQLGRVGLTESEARARGYDVRVASLPMNYVGRALETDEARGMMKAVIDITDGRILGCAVLGVEGGEIVSIVQAAMMGGLTTTQLRDAVFAHPTLAESLNNLFAG